MGFRSCLSSPSLEKMMKLYKAKYPRQLMSDRMMLEGLKLHEMADKRFMPKMLNGVTWIEVKNQINKSVAFYNEKRIKS